MDFYSGSLFVLSLASLILGGFVFLKGKDKLPNVTLGLFSLGLAWWCFSQFMGEMVAAKESVLFWTREGIAAAIFLPVFFLHFIQALTGRALKEAKLIWLAYGLGLVFLALDFTPFFVADVQPVFGFRYYPRAGIVYPFFAVFLFACFGYAFWRLYLAYKRAGGSERNKLLYVIIGCWIGFLGSITTFFPLYDVNFPVLSHIGLSVYVLITVYAIVKHQLLDISVIVRQGLVYSTLTLVFTGFYVLAVLLTNYFLLQFGQFNPLITVILVIFIAVVVFLPLRDRVQRLVDRIFFRGEYQYIKTINDLSAENRELFLGLLRANKLAALGRLSSGLAHEIKNPLASIKGMTQVLEENLGDPAFIQRYQDVLARQIARINGVIEEMLKIGQAQGLSLRPLSLKQLIGEVLVLLTNEIKRNNIQVDFKAEDLPEIEGDPEQLSQMFMNVILNAVQAMGEGGVLIIRAGVRKQQSVEVIVSDTGMGIPDDKLDKVFDPFFTLKERGSGLGLSAAYRIATEHNGDIKVESEFGKGSKFTICLPIKHGPSA